MIDIINDVYTFYFIVILPKKIHDNIKIHKLYVVYFEILRKMYSYITGDSHRMDKPPNDSSIETSTLFKSYMASKQESIFSKVWNIAHICKVIGFEDELYEVLGYLWINNEELVVLL